MQTKTITLHIFSRIFFPEKILKQAIKTPYLVGTTSKLKRNPKRSMHLPCSAFRK